MSDSEERTSAGSPDLYQEYKVYGNKYPTAEEALFRMAIDRVLTQEQKTIWEYWNYDRLTQKEIANKVKSEQSLIAKKIKTIEKHLSVWCADHLEVYKLLKELE